MGVERTMRLFRMRYAVCSCKSMSTDVCARNEIIAQNKIVKINNAFTKTLTRVRQKSLRSSQATHRQPTPPSATQVDRPTERPIHLYRDRRFDRGMRVVTD